MSRTLSLPALSVNFPRCIAMVTSWPPFDSHVIVHSSIIWRPQSALFGCEKEPSDRCAVSGILMVAEALCRHQNVEVRPIQSFKATPTSGWDDCPSMHPSSFVPGQSPSWPDSSSWLWSFDDWRWSKSWRPIGLGLQLHCHSIWSTGVNHLGIRLRPNHAWWKLGKVFWGWAWQTWTF